MRALLVVIALVVTAAPAAAQPRRGGRCTGEARDSSTMATAPVYRDCEVDRTAKVSNSIRPNFQPDQYGARSSCFRTELEFVVDTGGRPEMAVVQVVSDNSRELTDAVKQVLPTLRYEPAMRDGQAVRQLVRYKTSVAVRTVVSSSASGGYPSGASSRRPNC